MLRALALDVRRLQGAGGEPFTEFVDLLLRAHTGRHGLVDADIDTSIRTNFHDGGADTTVRRAVVGDPTGWMDAAPTVWQYKGTDLKNVTRSDLLKGPAVVARIRAGDAFRLAIADSPPDDQRRDWEEILTEQARLINAAAPAVRLVGADDLAAWATRYPGLVLRFFHPNFSDRILHLEAWARNARNATPSFTDVPAWRPVRLSLAAHVNLTQVPSRAVMSLQGEAGVGKTRLAYEVVSTLAGAEAIVLYCLGEDAASTVATELANQREANAVVVADECGAVGRLRLETLLSGHRSRVRVVAIDNTGRRSPGVAPEQLLGKMERTALSAMLAENFPNVPESRRRVYADRADGFPQLAADMCLHDSHIASAGTTQPVVASIGEYLAGRLTADHLEALAALALVTKIGYQGDVGHELDALCTMLGLDRRSIERAARAIHDGPGFVAAGGWYYYVTPEIVAQVTYDDAWRRWGGGPTSMFAQLPEMLIEPFLNRAWRSAPEEVRAECARYFRGWADAATPERLRDLDTVKRLVALTDTQPEEFFPRIRRLVEVAPLESLAAIQGEAIGYGGWGPRRLLVWLAERLAIFPEHFDNAERILLRLALAESEPSILNNATGIWHQLYRIQLSGTAIPFVDRLARLHRHMRSDDPGVRRLAASALDGILVRGGGRMVGPSVVAGRIPPDEWKPASPAEGEQCYEAVIAALREATSLSSDLRDAAVHSATKHAQSLIAQGFLLQLRQMLENVRLTDEELTDLVEALDAAMIHDSRPDNPRRRPGSAHVANELVAWRRSLVGDNLHRRLVATVGKDRWALSRLHTYVRPASQEDQHSDPFTDDVATLASDLVSDPLALRAALPWLMTDAARSAGDLGEAIGRLDLRGGLADIIISGSENATSKAFARGYVFALAAGDPGNRPALTRRLDDLAVRDALAAAELSMSCETPETSVRRLVHLFDAGRVPAAFLAARNFTIGTIDDDEHLPPSLLTALLERLVGAAEKGDMIAERVALDTLTTLIPYDPPPEPLALFVENPALASLAWRALEARPLGSSPASRWWRPIVVALGRLAPERAARLAGALLGSDDLGVREEGQLALTQLAKASPREVMAALGGAMLDERTGWRFFLGNAGHLVGALPVDLVQEWLSASGVEGARRIARSLPEPYIDQAGTPVVPPLTEWVLTTFENDDRTFQEFCAGVHSFQAYSGNIAEQHEAEASMARRFLDHPLRRIREWAIFEEQSATEDADRTRRWEAEANLP